MDNSEFKNLVDKSGLKKREIAELLGVSRMTINNWENTGVIPESKTKLIYEKLGKSNNVQTINKEVKSQTDREELQKQLDKMAVFAHNNQEAFWDHQYFNREIELRVSKRFLELTSDPNKFKDWLNNKA